MLGQETGRFGRWQSRPMARCIYMAAACFIITASLIVGFRVLVDDPIKVIRGKIQSHSSKPSQAVHASGPPESSSNPALQDGLEDVLGPVRPYDDGYTIVTPTYHRTESLPEFLDNYASGEAASLKRVIVIWNNEEDPPASLNDTLKKYPVPVSLERRERNSKNERFRRTPTITTAAVLALDDDMVIIPRDVEYMFQAWSTYHHPRTRMVGSIRRRDHDGMYRMSPSPDGYSMVLTKSAFFHVDWMDLWWAETQEMRDFRDYVDSRKLPDDFPDLMTGCEDIAMAFLYAHHTRVPPLWVAGVTFHDVGHEKLDGISTQPGHNDARTACVQHFRALWGNDTLVNTQIHAQLYPPGKPVGTK